MTFTVQSSCTRAGIVCASYTDSRAGECRNRVFLKNSNRCCGVSVLTARVVKVYMRTARVYIYRLAYSCVSVCADARGGGIGSTRGSPSESGTFHCRTRGGRIAIVLSLSIQLPLIRRWKTFSSFPGRGKFRCCSGLGSSRAETSFVVPGWCANSFLKCVVFANYWKRGESSSSHDSVHGKSALLIVL